MSSPTVNTACSLLRKMSLVAVLLVALVVLLPASAFAADPVAFSDGPMRELQKTLSPTPAQRYFGSSVAVDATTSAVFNPTEGTVYTYARVSNSWIQQQRIVLPCGPTAPQYSTSIAIQGDTMVIGNGVASDVVTNRGSAYVYTRTAGTWGLSQTLPAPGGAAGDGFGNAVAISGDTVAVGTRPINNARASIRVYTKSGATYVQQATLTVTPVAAEIPGYYNIDIDGDTLVAGSFNYPVNAVVGSAYVWTRTGTTWSAPVQLTAADGSVAPDAFGACAQIDGDTIMIGAFGEAHATTLSGSVYVYTRSGSSWVQTQEIEGTNGEELGRYFTLDGDTAVFTRWWQAPPSLDIYRNVGGTWTRYAGIAGSDVVAVNAGDGFGQAVALSGDNLVVGAYFDDITGRTDNGSAYFFDIHGYVTNEDAALVVNAAHGVLRNDTDPDSDPLTPSLVYTVNLHGTLVFGLGGAFIYTPEPNFEGTATAVYDVFDGTSYSPATITINVNPVNDPPVAVNDSATTDEDTDVTLNVLANDTDIDTAHASLVATTFSVPSTGTITTSASGDVTYTPPANWSGTATFAYRVFDGAAYSDFATATITVRPVNDAPVAVNDAGATIAGHVLRVSAPGVLGNDGDIDSGSLTAQLVTAPSHDAAFELMANGSYNYTPADDFVGTDVFTYRVYDGSAYSGTATVTLRVRATTPADFIDPAGGTVPASGSCTVTFTVGTASSFDFTASGDPVPTMDWPAGDLPIGLAHGVSRGIGTITGTPAAGTVGRYDLALRATNASGSAAIDVNVVVVDKPSGLWVTKKASAANVSPGEVVEYALAVTNSSRMDAPRVNVVDTFNPEQLVLTSGDREHLALLGARISAGRIEFARALESGESLRIVYSAHVAEGAALGHDTPVRNRVVVESPSVYGGDAETWVVVNAPPPVVPPTPPVARDDAYGCYEGGSRTVDAPGCLVNDSMGDGTSLSARVKAGPGHAARFVLRHDGSFDYVPEAGFVGTDSFSYTVSDGIGSDVAFVTMWVRPAHDDSGGGSNEPTPTVEQTPTVTTQTVSVNQTGTAGGAGGTGGSGAGANGSKGETKTVVAWKTSVLDAMGLPPAAVSAAPWCVGIFAVLLALVGALAARSRRHEDDDEFE